MEPFFTSDAVVFGILIVVLAAIFYTHDLESPGWKKFYKFVPALLLCYFLPALLHWPLGLISPHWYGAGVEGLISSYGLKMPSGMSYDAMTAFFIDNNVPAKGYDYLLSLDSKKLVNHMLDVHKLEMPTNLSADGKIKFFVDNGILAEGYKEFQGHSKLYYVASRYLLPASLILLCLSIDLKAIANLGWRAVVMFFAATIGIVLGGPIALLIVMNLFPNIIAATPDDLWRGLSTVAGSWIGGGANQTAMKEIFEVKDNLFATMIVVDVVVANFWMGFLLYGANISERIDKVLKADNTAIVELQKSVEDYRASVKRKATTTDMFIMLAIAFGGVAFAHWGADFLGPWFDDYNSASQVKVGVDEWGRDKMSPGTLVEKGFSSLMSHFFWLIVFATTVGLLMSFTKARKLEGVGASMWGSVAIYILVATIGMKMNIGEIWANIGLFVVGIIWMLVHVIILLTTAKLIKAPFFFVAVGSQANVGGAASAPIVASAFSPSLAPVGVLLAVLGYAVGTYFALVCAYLMQGVVG